MRRNCIAEYDLRFELLFDKSKDGKKISHKFDVTVFRLLFFVSFRPTEGRKSMPFYFRVPDIFRDAFLLFLGLFRKQRKSISSDFGLQRQPGEILDKV
jgi:hypothetical protein